MYKLYCILNRENGKFYIGMTKNSLSYRWNGHTSSARSGKKSKLYNAIRKYGITSFTINLLREYETKEECCLAEQRVIAGLFSTNQPIYNLAKGGEGGYIVPDSYKKEWKAKLSLARQGRKPALGMKHTEENKKFFSECNNRKIPKYPLEIIDYSYQEAKEKFNISKTHYYRLLKRTKINDLS